MALAFKLKYGAKERNPVQVIPDSSAVIIRGDILTLVPADNEVVKGTTNATYSYIAEEASAPGSVAPISATRIKTDDVLVATVSAGTPTASSNGVYVDITATGVTMTATNNDLIATYNGTTDTIDVKAINVL